MNEFEKAIIEQLKEINKNILSLNENTEHQLHHLVEKLDNLTTDEGALRISIQDNK